MRLMNPGPDYRDESHWPGEPEILGAPDQPETLRARSDWWRRPRLGGVLAVAAIALAGGAGVTYVVAHTGARAVADSSARSLQAPAASPSPSALARPRRGQGFARPGFFGGMGFGGFGGLGGVVHGQVTEPKAGGGYQTVDIQRGTVTAVSTSSITVKSADGFTKTYAVSSSTEVNAQAAGIATVKVGDSVELTATLAGSKTTAASIIDLSSIRKSHSFFGFPADPGDSKQS
jgi:hypothetical protein